MTDQVPCADALTPSGLGARGEALWRALGGHTTSDGARAALIVEASRMADRLEQLNALIGGDVEAWAKVELPGAGKDLVLRIDPAIAEARQSLTVFRHVLGQLTNVATQGTVSGGGTPQEVTVDDLEAKRNERRSAAANS